MPEQQITYKIDGMELIEKSLFRHIAKEDTIFKFDLKAQSLIDDVKELIVVVVAVYIRDQSDDKPVGNIVVAVAFNIIDFKDKILKNEKGVYIIPAPFDKLVKGVAISTTRGVMFSEFRGTPLHNAVLPVIMVDTLMPITENIVDIDEAGKIK